MQMRAFLRRSRGHGRSRETIRQLGNVGQAGSVSARPAGSGNHKIVAGNFALEIDLAANPPDGGVKRKESFDQALQK